MNFFNNSLSANKYLRIIKLSPKKLSKEFILRNFGLLIGDKSFYKILICFQLLEETKNIKGDIIEFGIWNGNNLFTIKKIIDFLKIKKKIYGYDNFSGFPNPESANKKNKKFGIYAGNRKFLRFVINFFKLKNIEIIDDDIMNLKFYISLKTLSAICSGVKEYFFNKKSYVPPGPYLSGKPIKMCFGASCNLVLLSAIAEPSPPIIECSSTLNIYFEFLQ